MKHLYDPKFTLKVFFQYLINRPDANVFTHARTLCTAILPGPALFFFGGFIHLTPSPGIPPNESQASQFVGRIAPNPLNHIGVYQIFGSNGNVTLFCNYPISYRKGVECLPENIVMGDDLKFKYWSKYNFIISVYSIKYSKEYVSYDDQVKKINFLNDLNNGKINFLVESWKNEKMRKPLTIFFIIMNLLSLLFLSSMRWNKWRYR